MRIQQQSLQIALHKFRAYHQLPWERGARPERLNEHPGKGRRVRKRTLKGQGRMTRHSSRAIERRKKKEEKEMKNIGKMRVQKTMGIQVKSERRETDKGI